MTKSWFVTLPLATCLISALVAAAIGWRFVSKFVAVLAAASCLVAGVFLASDTKGGGAVYSLNHMFKADALGALMLILIGSVAIVAVVASIDYLRMNQEGPRQARNYAVLVSMFVAALAGAVMSNNLGLTLAFIELTTVATAFLVGFHHTSRGLEASWKYVIICSVGLGMAFLGTVVMFVASRHVPGVSAGTLDLDVLAKRAQMIDVPVARIAFVLLVIGYGTKVGLFPFHTWLADAHSEAPAPVSGLMSGVLLSVALSIVLRLRQVGVMIVGPAFFRHVLLVMALTTLVLSSLLLLRQRDFKRMLAYSSLEHMSIATFAVAVGSPLAIAATLLHMFGHGLAKSTLFISAGHIQARTKSTLVDSAGALVERNRMVAGVFAAGILCLVGLPPFVLFSTEISIVRAAVAAHQFVALGLVALFVSVAFAALLRNSLSMLFVHSGESASVVAGVLPVEPSLAGEPSTSVAADSEARWSLSVSAALPLVLGLAGVISISFNWSAFTSLIVAAAKVVS